MKKINKISNLICPVIPPLKWISKEGLPQLFSWSRRTDIIPIVILSWTRGRINIITTPSTFDSTKKKSYFFYILWIFITSINSYLEPSHVASKTFHKLQKATSINCFFKSTQEWCKQDLRVLKFLAVFPKKKVDHEREVYTHLMVFFFVIF